MSASDDAAHQGRRDSLPPLPPHLDPRRRTGRHSRGSQRGDHRGAAWHLGVVGARVVGTILSVALLLGFGYGWYSYHSLNSNLHVIPISKPTAVGNTDIDGRDQNILIAGNDDRTNMTDAEVHQLGVGRDGGSLATDTMMIVHVPADGKAATLISLPRDAYVNIPGYGMNKLNAAYALGYSNTSGSLDQKRGAGATLLMQTVTNLTGLLLDNFVQVDLLGFVRISDAIGGVSVNLCHAVNDKQYSHLVMSAGKHTISGVTALEFVRQRHGLPNGDLDRTARQRYFLTASFRKIASAGTLLNPGRLHALIGAVDRSLSVGPGFDMLQFARQVSGLNANNIKGEAIPFVRFDDTSVGSVEIVDPAQVQQWVRNFLGQDPLAGVAAAAPSSVTMRVLNGGTVNHAAQRNAALLKGYGFHATYSTAAASTTATTIRYATGMEAAAKALAKYLPRNVVLEHTAVPVLTLVLGEDGMSVRASASGSSPAPSSSASGSAPRAPMSRPLDAGCIN